MPKLPDEITWQPPRAEPIAFSHSEDLRAWAEREAAAWKQMPATGVAHPFWNKQATRAEGLAAAAQQLDIALTEIDEIDGDEESRRAKFNTFLQTGNDFASQLENGHQLPLAHPSSSHLLALAEQDPELAALAFTAIVPHGNQKVANWLAQGQLPWAALFKALLPVISAKDASDVRIHREALASMDQRFHRATEEARETTANWERDFCEIKRKAELDAATFRSDWDARVEKNDKEWKAALRAYDEQMALAAPTTYWVSRARSARTSAGYYALAFATFSILSAACFFWFGLDYLEGIAELPNVSVIVAILPILVPAFMAVWVLRVLGRLLAESLSLEQDAREREVMVKTFLALMRDEVSGKTLVSDDDRLLILHALFRPSSLRSSDDAPPVHWFDILSKKLGGPK